MKALFLFAVLSSSTFAQTAVQDPVYVRVEKAYKYALAQNNSPDSIGALYDLLMSESHFVQLPTSVKAPLRPFVVQAEMSYRNGKGSGISEGEIVTAVNNLVTALNMPRHSLITMSNLEYNHDSDLLFYPSFMSYKRFQKGQNGLSSLPCRQFKYSWLR